MRQENQPTGGDRPLRVVEWRLLDEAARLKAVEPASLALFDDELRKNVGALIAEVRAEGDAALLRALERFDGCRITADRLRASEAEFEAARREVDPALQKAIRHSIDRVRRFNEHLLEHGNWQVEIEPGLIVGEKTTPIESAGLFVPSGKGSFPSVLVQIGTPAIVAGVPLIAVVVPPMAGSGGRIDPAVLFAAGELDIRNVFRANGPTGIAALAFGTATVPKVLKVLGPGSPPVAMAQIEVQRYGCLAHMLLGPSESLIIADSSADIPFLAADLLNEAEHGPDSSAYLVTDDRGVIEAIQREVAAQLAEMPQPRRDYATRALGTNGGAILVADMAEAAEVANRIAPEHMQIATRDDEAVLALIRNAGEILLGQYTTISSANYVIGVPAALPTTRFARVASGVTAEAFLKRSSIARATREAQEAMRETVVTYARHEGFPAHAAAAEIRARRK